ncbi:disease resistance protein RPS5-like [Macadamia integrifolia]|uniref:disease resistance protein RPS5-like n=1 Tax=Macadamia integrifolia TaxID=60698 RepID=UPI001C4FE63F|nr:disease resistance protein RPS5-like [Macadamia integrifolia]
MPPTGLLYQVGKDEKHMLDEVKVLLNEGQTFTVVSDPSLQSTSSLEFMLISNDLRNQMARLRELKEDVQYTVDEARMRGKEIKVVVEDWLTRVNQIQSEEMTLHNALEESKGSFQRGKKVAEESNTSFQAGKDVKNMTEGPQFSATMSNPSPLPPILESMEMLDFQIYDSAKSAMDQIMEALKDENKNIVGAYGIGGIGKTTLMKEVAKFLKKDGLFDQVVMVTVSQNWVLKNIQGKIAENLQLELEEEQLSMRARILSKRLKKEKRILIVLDDLWKPLNLEDEVGIPCGNNCKVILTTRHLQVCNQMKTQFNVEVKVLSEGDAWVLFKWAAGVHIENRNMLRALGKEIVGECMGLPLAIITVGKALRGKDPSVWKDAASQLKKSSSSPSDIKGVHEKVFQCIKLSYDSLGNEATKFCFLLCCMFPRDMPISEDDLLPYVVGERVFGDNDSLKEVRNKLQMHIEGLKGSCLLLDDSERMKGCIRMHDIIRDVSIWTASKGCHGFFVKSGRGLTYLLEHKENLRKCKRLSLMQNEITVLPNRLGCSDQLMTLSLSDNTNLREIPDGIFKRMTSLKTLDLGRTKISLIPSSLSSLTDLRVLRISGSQRTFYVSVLGKLKKLEILHITDCNVRRLTEEIGELTNLKSLDLSGNWGLIIAPNTLSRLSLLEELNLKGSFHEWEIDERSEEEEEEEEEEEGRTLNKKACLSEVASLSALTHLKIRVSNVKSLWATNIPLCWENLTQFSIILGDDWVSSPVSKCATQVHISGSIPPFSKWMIFLLERLEGLMLNQCHDVKYVHILSHGASVFNNIRVLHVRKCGDVEYILSSTTTTTVEVDEAEDHLRHGQEVLQNITIISNLEKLYLHSLPKLKAICHFRGGYSFFFNNLRFLDVFDCPGLISIIPSDLLAMLSNLEELVVKLCYGATEVFRVGNLQATTILKKLKRLDLQYLRSLRTIWKGIVSPFLSLMNLEEIHVKRLDNLNFMFSVAIVEKLQQLKRLEIRECPKMVQIISLIRSQALLPSTHPILGNLRSLGIYECDSLKHILPMSLAQGLLQLEELDISDCSNLEEIIFVDDGKEEDEEKTKVLLFPRLRCLKLVGLPNLSMASKRVLRGNHDCYCYWPSLEMLKVLRCHKLKKFPVIPQTMTPTKLREIEVEEEWFNELEWDDDQIDYKLYLQERVKAQRGPSNRPVIF